MVMESLKVFNIQQPNIYMFMLNLVFPDDDIIWSNSKAWDFLFSWLEPKDAFLAQICVFL